uniref:Uncharacterized protein n=1 Tax=Malurus cyaneus samueli TaxID=2593467 RepID=A0A8C5U1E3_9PASS
NSRSVPVPLGQVSGSVLSVYSGDFGSVDAQGTVEFALDYDEKNREFQVHVSQCKDLAVVDEKKGRSDPFLCQNHAAIFACNRDLQSEQGLFALPFPGMQSQGMGLVRKVCIM